MYAQCAFCGKDTFKKRRAVLNIMKATGEHEDQIWFHYKCLLKIQGFKKFLAFYKATH